MEWFAGCQATFSHILQTTAGYEGTIRFYMATNKQQPDGKVLLYPNKLAK